MAESESEIDFKRPLSSTPASSRKGSTPSTAPTQCTSTTFGLPQTKTSFGLMGAVGVVVTLTIFILDIVTDVLLSYALWNQAEQKENDYIQRIENRWFLITLLIIIIPTAVINVLSFIWYTQNKEASGNQSIYHQKSTLGKVACGLLHLLLLGMLLRYVDMLSYRQKAKNKRHKLRDEFGSRGTLRRLPPKEETNTTSQLQVMSRDTALLDMIHSFVQDAPQVVLQIYLLYKSSQLIKVKADPWDITLGAQLLKIIIGLFAISWTLVSYQEELRKRTPGARQLSCGATNICLFWRICMLGSRVIAIGSFAALQVNGEGGLVKVYANNVPRGLILSFPTITALVLGAHWILMVIWLQAQGTAFCSKADGSQRYLLEFAHNLFMGWVHIFSYINMKHSPSRRRIIFFYSLMFLENTGFIIVWYLQLISKELWLRVIVVLAVEALFVIGISCVIGYYAFLHPEIRNRLDNVGKPIAINSL